VVVRLVVLIACRRYLCRAGANGTLLVTAAAVRHALSVSLVEAAVSGLPPCRALALIDYAPRLLALLVPDGLLMI